MMQFDTYMNLWMDLWFKSFERFWGIYLPQSKEEYKDSHVIKFRDLIITTGDINIEKESK